MALPITPETNLALYTRELLKAQFRADVAAGAARPTVFPFDLLGTVLLPVIYLCIPHTRRPWLYRMRFAVVALMVWLNYTMMTRASSVNMAAAYVTGLAGTWGTLWGMTLLVWTRPQFEAERVERRLGRPVESENNKAEGRNGHVGGGMVRRRPNGTASKPKDTGQQPSLSGAPDETVADALVAGYTYYWQSYPADSPLSTRLDWVWDHMTSFRGIGRTTSITSVPSFKCPSSRLSSAPVDLTSIPIHTQTGYIRHTTRRSFLLHHTPRIFLSYVILDATTLLMLRDPYFVLGPVPPHSPYPGLPAYLSLLSPHILSILRSSLALTAIISALYLLFSAAQIVQFLLSHSSPRALHLSGCRADLWQYPSVFGSFGANVLDYGLSGFWGGWWHQTFRGAFVAPTNWLVRKGYLPGDKRHPWRKFVSAAIAFAQSGILHAGGSFTTVSRTARWWSPPCFFLLSLVGVLVQDGWNEILLGRERRERFPRWVRRGANGVFVLVWLHCTQWLFVDDLSRAGVWLYEPLPWSPLRALGYELPGDRSWRWDGDVLPRLWTGGRWWERGIAI
ncbi:membrane bound O-acyl transferase family-domain-containing protein [Coniochaeta sp. 2T2.1]|nr:membrane bound O-acyl transferase family-domain-containing protein [Coniochaeta sp. 2T2.1]